MCRLDAQLFSDGFQSKLSNQPQSSHLHQHTHVKEIWYVEMTYAQKAETYFEKDEQAKQGMLREHKDSLLVQFQSLFGGRNREHRCHKDAILKIGSQE